MGKFKFKQTILRISLIIFFLIPLIFFNDFYQHFRTYLVGGIVYSTIVQEWHIVIINIVLFTIFLIPLSFRRKVDWKERGIVVAFFTCLFLEMYGIPFTIFFISSIFYPKMMPPQMFDIPNSPVTFEFLGVNFAMDIPMIYGSLLILLGMALIIAGWITLYRNLRKKKLVTVGIYSYSRHPQYFGFILIIIGWFIGWSTIITGIFAAILVYKYISLSKREEREIPNYKTYAEKVPFFF
jgi:protein-S-isoprenylcysteine O-methyltransferase Ste14